MFSPHLILPLPPHLEVNEFFLAPRLRLSWTQGMIYHRIHCKKAPVNDRYVNTIDGKEEKTAVVTKVFYLNNRIFVNNQKLKCI